MPATDNSVIDKFIDSCQHAAQSLLFTCLGIAIYGQESTPAVIDNIATGAFAGLALSNLLQSLKNRPLQIMDAPAGHATAYPNTLRVIKLSKSAAEHCLTLSTGSALFAATQSSQVLALTSSQDRILVSPMIAGYGLLVLKHALTAWYNNKTHAGHPSSGFACYTTAGILGSAAAGSALSTLLTHDGNAANMSGFMHQQYGDNEAGASGEYALLFFGVALAQMIMLLTRCFIGNTAPNLALSNPSLSEPLKPNAARSITEIDDMEQGHTTSSATPANSGAISHR